MAINQQEKNIFLSLGALGAVIVIVCVIGIVIFHGKETEFVQGQAEVNEYRVSSKVPGRILEIRVREGQRVKAGDTLAILEAPDIEAKLAQAKAVKNAASAQNAKAQKGARQEEIQGAYE